MIQVNNLSYTYPGSDSQVLKNISFHVEAGEVFGFLGPSGAGKSTTQKVLNGLLRGYSGTVRVNGTDMSRMERSFYEKIGVAFEFPNLYLKLSALENLQLFSSFFKSRTENPEALLEKVHLWDDRHTRVEAFSKGMKMRLSFARALLNQPEILFLDEPTAGLDPANARIMKNIILEMKQKGASIFLTTHHMDDADELCRRLAFMIDGTLPVMDYTQDLKLRYGEKKLRVEYRSGDQKISRSFPLERLAENREFSRILREEEILTMHSLEASLEDIFIQVTGRQLKV